MLTTVASKPARDRAARYLLELVRVQAGENSLFLPSLDILARDAGVSRMTMFHAVGLLKKEGALRSAGTRGTVIVAIPPVSLSQAAPVEPVALEARLGRDIAEGVYSGEDVPFPGLKELSANYAVSYRRIRTALERLTALGLLVRRERRFAVARPGRLRGLSTLVCIAASDDMAILANATPRSLEFWRVLEQECALRGIAITVLGLEKAVSRFVSKCRKSLTADTPVLGFICWNVGLKEPDLAAIAAIAMATKRPLALLDELGTLALPSALSANPLCRTFSAYGTQRSGITLGAHLLDCGYRQLAYVSSENEQPSPRKLGLEQAFAAAGMSQPITTFSLPKDAKRLENAQKSGTLPTAINNADLLNLFRQNGIAATGPDIYRLHVEYLDRFINLIELRTLLSPLLGQIVSGNCFDCIVGDNDLIALLALEYLRKRGIAVPRAMGVAGFDDTVSAIGLGLSSLNWNIPGIVRSMMQFVLRPGEFDRLFGRAGHSVEIDGVVMARESTARVTAAGTVV